MRSLSTIILLLSITLFAAIAQGQVASALVIEGELLADGSEYTADSIAGAAVNNSQGWAFNMHALDAAGGTISLAFGTLDGMAAADVLRTEQTIGDYQQNAWESFFGLSGVEVSYSPSCTRLSDGEDGLDGVWYGDTIVGIEQEPYPHMADTWWSFGSRPGATQDGIPYFVGGITDELGGSTDIRGLFYGFDTTPLIIGGMMIDGLDDPVVNGSGAVSFDYRFSAFGTNYLAEVATETGSSNNDNHMVSNGAVLLVGSLPVSEGSPIPEVAGGLPGENWDNFDYVGITEGGQWLLTGDTDGDTATDEFLMLNGGILLREGDMIDGIILVGSIESAYLNEQGDWACVWDIDAGGEDIEALIINGEIVLYEGMEIDIDGDGVVDPDAVLTAFTGIASLALADRNESGLALAYFTADVDVNMPGPALDAGQWLRADEAAGLDEDYLEEPRTRAEVEMGLVFMPEGVVSIVDDGQGDDELPSTVLTTMTASPNPFNPSLEIKAALAQSGAVRVSIVDMRGRQVRVLHDGYQAAGGARWLWDGRDSAGRTQASGVYMVRLETAQRELRRTVTLVK